MLAQVAGFKSYAIAAAMIAYAVISYLHPVPQIPPMDLNTALGVVAAALSLIGIRSGLTTEVAKLLEALGVNTANGAAATAALVGAQPTPLGALVDAASSVAGKAAKGAGKVAGLLLVAILVAPLLGSCTTIGGALVNAGASIAGPSSSSAVKAVATVELSYTTAAIAATAWLKSGLATPAQAAQVEALNDAVHAELVAARGAAENGNDVTITATYTALVQGMAAFTAFETANKIGVTP